MILGLTWQVFWRQVCAGRDVAEAASVAGVSVTAAQDRFREAGGVMPRCSESSGARLSLAEREEIMTLQARECGVREIARQLGRSPSTISRELRRRARFGRGGPRGPRGYRASAAQADAEKKARRPKSAKLATVLALRKEVKSRLERNHSPEQIAARLRDDFPDDTEMWVSHETIYQSLYVQSRGGLSRELTRHLRTGRSLRKPRRRADERRGRIAGIVSISERPPEIADRAVIGHWEGDLIIGSTVSKSAIGTLVERKTGFTMLLHLPDGHTALAVQEAMVAKMADLPRILRQTLTWDQGKEMANHAQIAAALDLDIYFAHPHSPWERGSNENTNGLLRQYFPKGTDLSVHGEGILDHVAAELNNRPRKRHAFQTPAEMLDKLLSNPSNPPGVATTA